MLRLRDKSKSSYSSTRSQNHIILSVQFDLSKSKTVCLTAMPSQHGSAAGIEQSSPQQAARAWSGNLFTSHRRSLLGLAPGIPFSNRVRHGSI